MTANVETAVINYMLGSSAIVAVTSNRIYPSRRPQGSAVPSIILTRVSGAPLYADDGEVGLLDARLQIDCYAITYTAAKDLAGLVLTRLSAVADVVQSGVTIRYITLENEQDIDESGSDEFEYLHRISQDYRVWTDH